MRIAYVYLGASLKAVAGVKRKVLDQVGQWTAEGHSVSLYLQLGDAGELTEPVGDWGGLRANVFGGGGSRNVVLRFLNRDAAIRRLVDTVLRDGADVVYLRFSPYYPALDKLIEAFPICLEINSDDLEEYPRRVGPLPYAYHRATRQRLLHRTSGVVFVTQELAEREHFAQFGRPFEVITNGIALDRVRQAAPAPPGPMRLVFIGEPGLPWHGVDKILRLARALPECRFDLIGYSADDLHESAPPNVHPLGYVTGDAYRALLDGATAGIGTLALHRKGMDEACPLKVRDYLAAGLPVIIAYSDLDIPGSHWYSLRLHNTEDNIERGLPWIRAFLESVRGRRVARNEIAHLDTATKERQRLEFMARLAAPAAG